MKTYPPIPPVVGPKKTIKTGFTHESTYNESKEWYTPKYIFDALGLEFDLDPCSPGADIVSWIPAKRHLTIEDNGLIAHWEGNVFMNPPYGMDTPKWFEHLALYGNGIGLVFARTDTKGFHQFVLMDDAICFIKGSVPYVSADDAKSYSTGVYKPQGGCVACSMLLAFGKNTAKALFDSGLGLTLSVVKPTVDGHTGERFVIVPLAIPSVDNDDSPRNAESRKC